MRRRTLAGNDATHVLAAASAEAGTGAPAPTSRRSVLRLFSGIAVAASTLLGLAACGGDEEDEGEEDDD